MPIIGILTFIITALVIMAFAAITIVVFHDTGIGRIVTIVTIIVSILLTVASYKGIQWYYNNTESGKRAVVDQKSDFGGGLERTINVYTADGEIIATYTGKIDIENKEGGYLLFDYNGKRYTYYNCFVESIADIE